MNIFNLHHHPVAVGAVMTIFILGKRKKKHTDEVHSVELGLSAGVCGDHSAPSQLSPLTFHLVAVSSEHSLYRLPGSQESLSFRPASCPSALFKMGLCRIPKYELQAIDLRWLINH